jgi:hypothetical protein
MRSNLSYVIKSPFLSQIVCFLGLLVFLEILIPTCNHGKGYNTICRNPPFKSLHFGLVPR